MQMCQIQQHKFNLHMIKFESARVGEEFHQS